MRILALCEFFDRGHNEASFRVLYRTAMKMSQIGHDVTFMYPSHDRSYARNRVNGSMLVVRTPGLLPRRFRTGGWGFLDGLWKSLEVLKHDYDVVFVSHGHRPSQFVSSLLAKCYRKAAIVGQCWEWLGPGGYADVRQGITAMVVGLYDCYLEQRLTAFFDHVITISSTLKTRFSPKNKVTVLNGAADNIGLKNYKIEHARSMVGLPRKAFCIGMSNLNRSDHQDNSTFFESFRHLCKSHHNLLLIATGSDLEYIKEVGEIYGIGERMISPGYIDYELYNRYLSSCNVYVLPYPDTLINRARWPNKIGDFLCLNRPIITNPTGDIVKLFDKYKIGILCEATPEGYCRLFNKIITEKNNLAAYAKDCLYVANNILAFDLRINKLLRIFKDALEIRIDRYDK